MFPQIRSALDKVSGIIYGYPAYCSLCSALPVGEDGVCSQCIETLENQMTNTCIICGIPLASPLTLCQTCRLNMYYFDRAKSAGIYRGLLKDAILRMKYRGERWLSRPLGHLLSNVAVSMGSVDMVVPIPLEPSSMEKRGYNQAKDLALYVSYKIKVPLFDILIREGKKDRQAKLKKLSRWENLRDTMKVETGCEIPGSIVLLVDDVMTTGATLDEGARALKQAGAEKVLCATLARTVRY